jgi:hypothetical protein
VLKRRRLLTGKVAFCFHLFKARPAKGATKGAI